MILAPSRPATWTRQACDHGDLIGLAVRGHLGADHPGAVNQACHQVWRGTLAGPGAAQGLAVDREHHPAARRIPLPAHPARGDFGAPDGSVTDIWLPRWFAHNLPAIHIPLLAAAAS